MEHLSDTQLNEYLDDALPTGERHYAREHLESCDDCRARFDELQLVFKSLAELPDIHLSRDLAPGILSRLPQKITPLWSPAFAAQVGAALGIILWISYEASKLINYPILPINLLSEFTFSGSDHLLQGFSVRALTINLLSELPKFQSLHISLNNLPNLVDLAPKWQFSLSNFSLLGITISALLLWLSLNTVLLRGSTEVKK
jgi:hypothetical protein